MSIIPTLEACRKRKRRPKLFDFHSFGDPGCPISPIGPFRENIRLFLRECAEKEEYCVEGMRIWCTLLLVHKKSFIVPLYTIEEDVRVSPRPFCDYCRFSGWSNKFVSKRKYHLIIPVDDEWNRPLNTGVFDLHSHLLHGLIHCSGFGHLVCINGIEGGSKFLCGREIMDLWDRICSNLRIRKITVEDVSKKRSMDLRLLHGTAYGHPWFGRWGYRFCRGSFGVKEHNYNRAIEILCSLDLDQIICDFCNTDRWQEIKEIICHYRDLSEKRLTTLQDLLRFMLTIKSCAPMQKNPNNPLAAPLPSLSKPLTREVILRKPLGKEKCGKYRKFTTAVASMDSRWPAKRLEYAAHVIVDALKERKADKFSSGGMTRQEVRDAARLHIGDTGLLDYVLKSLNNVIVGNHIVRRAVNSSTRILEYTIQETGNGIGGSEKEAELVTETRAAPTFVAGVDVLSDIAYFYTHVLLAYPESEIVEVATRVVLDSKHFVKVWPFRDEADQFLRFICRLIPSSINFEGDLTKESPPSEIVILPLHATVGELKQAIEDAFRDTYCITEKMTVKEIENMGEFEDEEVLFGALDSGSEILVRGCGIDWEDQLRHEGGLDNWTVRCECGARDDDGERMVACDICEVWQHTRCCGIDDSETVPPLFICPGCCVSLMPPRTSPIFEFEASGSLPLIPLSEYRV